MLEMLSDELKKPEYGGLSDGQIVEMINNKVVTVRGLVPTWQVKQHAIENGYYAAIKICAEDSQSLARSLCINVIAWIDDQAGKIQNLDMDAAATISMCASLVQAGLITSEQSDSLRGLANKVVKWTDNIGIGEVGIGYIRAARRMS